MKFVYFAAVGAVALTPASMAQDSFSVEPGQWRTTTLVTMSMMPEPQSNTDEQCITPEEATFSPDELLGEDNECNMDSMDQSATAMSFSMSCNMEGGITMSGQGTFETLQGGTVMSGVMDLTGAIPGLDQNVDMSIKFSSERIGDCQ